MIVARKYFPKPVDCRLLGSHHLALTLSPTLSGGAGFGLLTFLPGGGMNVELIRLGHDCALWPSAATAEEVAQAARFADVHLPSYAPAKAAASAPVA